MKNQKGITLIALVITIIVLLILAGVSIAMLTGDNGILTQSRNAKVSQIEGTVKEEVNLAVQSAKMYAEEKAVTTTGGWLASTPANLGSASDSKTTDTVIGTMRTDLGSSYTITPTSAAGSTPAKLTIEYTNSALEQATNKAGAKITIIVDVENNTFTVHDMSKTY